MLTRLVNAGWLGGRSRPLVIPPTLIKPSLTISLTLLTKPSCFSTCNIEKLWWAWERGYSLCTYFFIKYQGTRERSPPLPKISHPSLPRLGRSQASTWPSAMHKSPPGGTACLITVSPMPGKLTCWGLHGHFYVQSSEWTLVGLNK